MAVRSLLPFHHRYCQGSITFAASSVVFSSLLAVGGITTAAQAQSLVTPTGDETGSIVTQQSTQQGTQFHITAGSQSADGVNLFHSFEDFSVSTGDRATFFTDPNIQNVLSRVTGGSASVINGQIQIQGADAANLFLMNPAGILIGPDAHLNLPANLTLTTADAIGFDSATDDFTAAFQAVGPNLYSELTQNPTGDYRFDSAQPGSIINQGNITVGSSAAPAADLTLIGGNTLNTGTLSAPGGTITVAAIPGESTVRISQADALLSLEVSPNLTAEGDRLRAIAPLDLPTLLTHTEQAHADNLSLNPDGTVSLTAASTAITGNISVENISANVDSNQHNPGGTIALLGEQVTVANADISASGTYGGGNIYIGGGYQGADTLLAATETRVDENTHISADALQHGTGGQVVVWANDTTQYLGDISATGGSLSGNGGTVEVSGKETLLFQGSINTQAPQGEIGSLLLDPVNIFISDREIGKDDNQLLDYEILAEDGAGFFEISAAALENLSAQSDITLQATNNIVFGNLASNKLTFAAGSGNITFTADADHSNVGSIVFRDPDDVIIAPGRHLTLSGHWLSLGSLSTESPEGGGNITLRATNHIQARELNANSTENAAGNISLTATDSIDIDLIRVESPIQPGTVSASSQQDYITVDFLFPGIREDINFSAPGDILVNGKPLLEDPIEEPINEPNVLEPAGEQPPSNELTPEENSLIAQLGALSALSAESSSDSSSSDDGSGGQYGGPQRTELSSQDASEALAALDTDSHQAFSDYFGRDLETTEMALEDVQALLADIERDSGNRSAVIYAKAENDSSLELLLFTAEGAPIKITLPAVKREQLLTVVGNLRADLITSARRGGDYYLEASQQLYDWMIEPLEQELATANIDTLVFAMDEGLRGIPMAALHSGESFLIEQYSLGVVPSLGMLNNTQYSSLSSAKVLAMGVSDFTQYEHLNELPGVPEELETIRDSWSGTSFLNEQFTKQNLITQRRQVPYEMVHLATHAEFRPGDVDDSYIQLWDEKLLLSELDQLGWRSPAVELLVLSACNTASGSVEAEMGFAGLAIAAGVDSAMASLWSINDLGTLALMDEFYTQLRQAPTKSEALQQTQLTMVNETSEFSHPYYWSGFTMIGSPW